MTAEMTRLRRYVLDACDGPFGSAIASEHYSEAGARVIRLGNIGSAEWKNADSVYIPIEYWQSLKRHHASRGDVVVAALGDANQPVGRAAVVPDVGPALVKADCHRLRVDRASADPRYLAYALSSDLGRYEAGRMADGSTRKRLTIGKTLNLVVPVAALDEQRRIADFLDAETARIDAVVAQKRRFAALLLERRAAVIVEAVEGRLTSDPRCWVSASLPWLRLRPAHWREAKLGLVARLGSGHTPSRNHPEWWEDCNIPWVTTGEVSQMRDDRIEHLRDTREKISRLGLANSSAELHPEGTVVLSRTAASAGFSAIMGADMATSQDVATWTCGPLLLPRFLLLCLRAMRQDLLGRLAMGSTHRTIYMPEIESIRVPLPPVHEQAEIVDAAWRILSSIDELSDLVDRQLELVNEHRQSLISSVVADGRSVA